MDNQKQYIELEERGDKSHIDFKALYGALKKHKSLYWKVLPASFVVACVIVLSIPKYYTCEVQLAPELTTTRNSGSISALASQFGLKMGMGTMGNSEALYPTLYPDFVNSSDFKVSLFNVPVHRKDSIRVMTYYDYLRNDQDKPWWNSAISAVVDGVKKLMALEDTIDQEHIDPFQLTNLQTKIIKSLEKKIVCDVDNKTLAITITVTDQDPLICAVMADSVQARLQDFITEYRTKKARVDLEFNRRLYDEAKRLYDEAREEYATYADANLDLMYQKDRTKLINLENEMQLRYNAFNSIAQQLTSSEAKVQQDTPAFTTLQRATVPVKKAGPPRVKIVLAFLFLAFLCTSAWILYKEDQLKPLLGLS